tara:strand:- start:34 stop:513 length:480 start_codon:yes stop_codon:yes gene_type:complete
MDHEITIIDSVLTCDECDFLIDYFKKFPNKKTWGQTVLIWLEKQSLLNLKLSYILFKYTRKIKQKYKLKKNCDQIVFRAPSSYMKSHKDGKEEDNNNEWSSICYLNDNFEGGETFIEGEKIKVKKGRVVIFPGKRLYHGVSKVIKYPRYTLISWWREND